LLKQILNQEKSSWTIDFLTHHGMLAIPRKKKAIPDGIKPGVFSIRNPTAKMAVPDASCRSVAAVRIVFT